MTRAELLRMALEAGIPSWWLDPPEHERKNGAAMEQMERFAALVYAAGVAAERKACSDLCESRNMGDNNREDMEAKRCAAAIRARSNNEPQ